MGDLNLWIGHPLKGRDVPLLVPLDERSLALERRRGRYAEMLRLRSRTGETVDSIGLVDFRQDDRPARDDTTRANSEQPARRGTQIDQPPARRHRSRPAEWCNDDHCVVFGCFV